MHKDQNTKKVKKEVFVFQNDDKVSKFVLLNPAVVPLLTEKYIINDIEADYKLKQKSSWPLNAKEKNIKGTLHSPYISKEKVIDDIINYVTEMESIKENRTNREKSPKHIKLSKEVKELDTEISHYQGILKLLKKELDELIDAQQEASNGKEQTTIITADQLLVKSKSTE